MDFSTDLFDKGSSTSTLETFYSDYDLPSDDFFGTMDYQPSPFDKIDLKSEFLFQQLAELSPRVSSNTTGTDILFPPATACSPAFNYEAADESLAGATTSDTAANSVVDSLVTSVANSDVSPLPLSASEEDNLELTYDHYPLIRGVSAGGFSSRPPRKTAEDDGFEFVKCRLTIVDADYNFICSPSWTAKEKKSMRRIVRVRRSQMGSQVIAQFSIIDSDEKPLKDRDVCEISCLECLSGDDGDSKFYVTSVDVLKMVELLIDSTGQTKEARRKERGRIRSNLVPFWSDRPVNSKRAYGHCSKGLKNDADFKKELAQRIMAYKTRKPRGFDKDVRILEWSKLVPALQRALQSYYVRIPISA